MITFCLVQFGCVLFAEFIELYKQVTLDPVLIMACVGVLVSVILALQNQHFLKKQQHRNEIYHHYYYMLEHRKRLIMESNIRINKLETELELKQMHDINMKFLSLEDKISTEKKKLESYHKGYYEFATKIQKDFSLEDV